MLGADPDNSSVPDVNFKPLRLPARKARRGGAWRSRARRWLGYACHDPIAGRFFRASALLVVLGLDPFGFSQLTGQASRDMVDRLHGVTEPASAAKHVAVVLVDQSSLIAGQAEWPPSFDFWHELLVEIASYEPASIFLDVILSTDRSIAAGDAPGARRRPLICLIQPEPCPEEEVPETAAAIQLARRSLFLADHGGMTLDRLRAKWDCKTLTDPVRCPGSAILPALHRPAGPPHPFIDWSTREDPRLYPLSVEYTTAFGAAGEELVLVGDTVAPLLARRGCAAAAPPNWCRTGLPPPRDVPRLAIWPTKPEPRPPPLKELAVIPRWSLFADPEEQAKAARLRALNFSACHEFAQQDAAAWWRRLGVLANSLLSEKFASAIGRQFDLPDFTAQEAEEIRERPGTEPAKPIRFLHNRTACLPFPVVSATHLFRTSVEAQELLRTALAGRHVLIGTRIAGDHDLVYSPLHGQVPGVMLHATALETLLRSGADFPTAPDGALSANHAEGLIKVALLLASLFSAWLLARRAARGRRDRRHEIRVGMATIVLILGATLALFCFYANPLIGSVNLAEILIFAVGLVLEEVVQMLQILFPPRKAT
jgi:CHASE2 domain-containing sensor protein